MINKVDSSRAGRFLRFVSALVPVVGMLGHVGDVQAAEQGKLRFNVTDAEGRQLPCRIHCFDKLGKPQQPDGLPFWRDHFVCSGQAEFDVIPGRYRWEIERGPEHNRVTGVTEVTADTVSSETATLTRIANLKDEGWYSGDLHVHRPVADVPLLMRAEDLDFSPVITWWNRPAPNARAAQQTEFRFDGHRIYTTMAGEDEREGGALLYFGLKKPLDLTVKSREYPSPMHFLKQARQQNKDVWVDIEKPFWWDVPTWIASGEMNSIGIANNHMCRSQMYESEAWGRPRDQTQLPAPRGNGFWTQEIYYHLLNSGIRMPPSAGSASGVLPNPVGYNRVYVHLGTQEFTRDTWFQSLAAGRCFVTNGPLLRVRADDSLPGTVLRVSDPASSTIDLKIHLTTVDPVSAVEVVCNGNVIQSIPCTNQQDQRISAEIPVDRSGWFLVRVITDVEHTFRFASTAPWYVESKEVPRRISRRSAQFFLDWVDQRIERIERNVTDADQLRAVLESHKQAREFWQNRVRLANADQESESGGEVE